MNSRVQTTAAALLLACVTALGVPPAMAEHPAGPTCMDIQWNVDLLKSFPRAPAACQGIAVRNGKKFARFTAKVTSVTSDIVKVRFLTSAGNPEREISLKPGPDARVELAGQKVEYSKLKNGDVLTFWVPEGQLGVVSDPDATAASTIILK